MTISTIVLAITGVFGGGGGRGSPPKEERILNKWLNRLVDVLKGLVRKAVENMPAIVRSFFGVILSFLGKADGIFAEYTWVLIVFIAGLIGALLIQKIKKG